MNATGSAGAGIGAGGILTPRAGLAMPVPRFTLHYACFGPDGRPKWRGTGRNLVTTEGLNRLLDVFFDGAAQITAWYLGLVNDADPSYAASDTLASHPGWTEGTLYAGNRKAIAFGEPAGGALAASAAASFAITGTMANLVGAFVTSAETGTAGVLYSVADIDVARAVAAGDTLNITPTVSFASA